MDVFSSHSFSYWNFLIWKLFIGTMLLGMGGNELLAQDQFSKVKLSWKAKKGKRSLKHLRLYETFTGSVSFLRATQRTGFLNSWEIQTEPWGRIGIGAGDSVVSISGYLGQKRLEGALTTQRDQVIWEFTVPGDTFLLMQEKPVSADSDSLIYTLSRVYEAMSASSPGFSPSGLLIPLLRISGVMSRPKTVRLEYLQTDPYIANLVQIAAVVAVVQPLFTP